PLLLSSRVSPLECDYNFHKSNSTYFSDFDVGRMHLLMCLCRSGIEKTGYQLWEAAGKKGSKFLWIMMGGVSCSFRREIKPLGGYEMWNRILAWDRKWIYVIIYFVEKGKVRPKGWSLQPWKKDEVRGRNEGKAEKDKGEKKKGSHPAVYATGIAKYVAKRGRLTVPPELILRNSELLPPVPEGRRGKTSTPPMTDSPAVPLEGDAVGTAAAAAAQVENMTSRNADELIDAKLNTEAPGKGEDEEWDWDRIEAERVRGMKIAEAWNMTEKLGEEFDGGEGDALGKYWDFP
ncbi:MAG: hypothetical protein Q9222_005881, partial [Ikaeria aurantiellina]